MQVGKVELDDVVTHHKIGARSQPVKRNKRIPTEHPLVDVTSSPSKHVTRPPAWPSERGPVRPLDTLVGVGARSCQSVDAAVMPRDFKVYRQAP